MFKKIALLLIVVFIGKQLFAHSGKPKYHIVLDTDGAIDDMRSICMFLSGNDMRVLAITCSQGTLYPDSVYDKVSSLLSAFHHEGIPVGIGNKTGQELPNWSSFAQGIEWGEQQSKKIINQEQSGANQVLTNATEFYRYKITLVALGSLKTYADWIKSKPEVISKIEKIVWYNNPDIKKGFNYKASPKSYDYITKTGIELVVVGNNSNKLIIDDNYLNSIRNTNSVYANQISNVHSQTEIKERINQQHLHLWDDIVPLYFTAPILFEFKVNQNIRFAHLNQNTPNSLIYKIICKLLESANTTNNRVFKAFPVDSTLYKPDYVKILNSTIRKFGLIEWKAICMTNEIHGHTGIYSIIGAKTGIRAMEYFNVGVNNLSVTTYSGNKPPLSCFNDGIQISTGATIGQGLITVSDSIFNIPTSIFEFNNQKVQISLKKEIARQIQQDIKYGVQTYGLLTDKYWLYIEKLAVRYWNEYSRYEICNIRLL